MSGFTVGSTLEAQDVEHQHTETQRHRDTETQRHRDTETQRHRDTETQRHTDTETHTHTQSSCLRHESADPKKTLHINAQLSKTDEREKRMEHKLELYRGGAGVGLGGPLHFGFGLFRVSGFRLRV